MHCSSLVGKITMSNIAMELVRYLGFYENTLSLPRILSSNSPPCDWNKNRLCSTEKPIMMLIIPSKVLFSISFHCFNTNQLPSWWATQASWALRGGIDRGLTFCRRRRNRRPHFFTPTSLLLFRGNWEWGNEGGKRRRGEESERVGGEKVLSRNASSAPATNTPTLRLS